MTDYGQPETIVSDNGPQFSGKDFRLFCQSYNINHSTSSPLHPSGNGQVERTVGTVKNMMRKCMQESGDWLQGLLTLRNTPVGTGLLSPSELLQGRLLRDSHPVPIQRYQIAGYDTAKARQVLGDQKSTDKYYFDNHAKSEKSVLQPGQQVHARTAAGEWRLGEVDRVAGVRSYWVNSRNHKLRRNRKDLRPTAVVNDSIDRSSPINSACLIPDTMSQNQGANEYMGVTDGLPQAPNVISSPKLPIPSPEGSVTTRSGRRTQRPKWHEDYHF